MNPTHTIAPHFINIHFIFHSTHKTSKPRLPFRFPNQNFICISCMLHAACSNMTMTFGCYNFPGCNTCTVSCCNSELVGTTAFLLLKCCIVIFLLLHSQNFKLYATDRFPSRANHMNHMKSVSLSSA